MAVGIYRFEIRCDRLGNSDNCSKFFEVTIEGEGMGDAKTLHDDFTRTVRKALPFIAVLLKHFPGAAKVSFADPFQPRRLPLQ